MSQINVSKQQMIDFARSLDERLEEHRKYPDEWIIARINTGFELVATYRQPFLTEEVLDLNPYITDGTKKIEVTLDEDMVGVKRIFATRGEDSITHKTGIRWKVEYDNSIHIVLTPGAFDTSITNLFTIQYYFYPKVPAEETFMSTDIYQMVKHGIQNAVWEQLHDSEKAGMALGRLKENARMTISGLDIDVEAHEEWNGGFIL